MSKKIFIKEINKQRNVWKKNIEIFPNCQFSQLLYADNSKKIKEEIKYIKEIYYLQESIYDDGMIVIAQKSELKNYLSKCKHIIYAQEDKEYSHKLGKNYFQTKNYKDLFQYYHNRVSYTFKMVKNNCIIVKRIFTRYYIN
jgi:hypothetical protein